MRGLRNNKRFRFYVQKNEKIAIKIKPNKSYKMIQIRE